LFFFPRSTATGELALCYLTSYSSHSVWTADIQAIKEVPFKLNYLQNFIQQPSLKSNSMYRWHYWRSFVSILT